MSLIKIDRPLVIVTITWKVYMHAFNGFILLLCLLSGCSYQPKIQHSNGLNVAMNPDNQITYVGKHGKKLGFEEGDHVVGFDGKNGKCEQIISQLFSMPSANLSLEIERQGELKTIPIPSGDHFDSRDLTVDEMVEKLLTCGTSVNLLILPGKITNAFSVPADWYQGMRTMVVGSGSMGMTKKFMSWPNFSIVDRSSVDQILSELHFQQTGAVSPDKITEIGKMTGATHIYLVELSRFPKGISFIDVITAKLIEIESAKVIAAAGDTIDAGGHVLRNKKY